MADYEATEAECEATGGHEYNDEDHYAHCINCGHENDAEPIYDTYDEFYAGFESDR